MTDVAEQLKSQLMELPLRDRAELAYFLIHSLDDAEDPEAEAAWEAELDRRFAEIRSGKARGRPAEDVMRELREKHVARLRAAYSAAAEHGREVAEEWRHVDRELDDRDGADPCRR